MEETPCCSASLLTLELNACVNLKGRADLNANFAKYVLCSSFAS